MFRKAVEALMNDSSFQTPSLQAKAAITTASNVLHWSSIDVNRSKLEYFCKNLVSYLKQCFEQGIILV
jgi:hypothetical protein